MREGGMRHWCCFTRRRAPMIADVMSFSATIRACEKRGQCEHALGLPHKIREWGLTGNVVSPHMPGAWQYRHDCTCSQLQQHGSACEKEWKWEHPLVLLRKMGCSHTCQCHEPQCNHLSVREERPVGARIGPALQDTRNRTSDSSSSICWT